MRTPARRPAPKRAKPVEAKSTGRVSASRTKSDSSRNDTREWLRNAINWDARTATILGIVVFAVFSLAPSIQTWFSYQQQIIDMQAQVEQAKQAVKDMKAERKRWDDPAYVRAQARERLYYVLPGEVSYLVMDAGSVNTSDTSGTVGAALAAKRNTTAISTSIRSTADNWVEIVAGSVIRAGIEQPAAEPTPTPTATKKN